MVKKIWAQNELEWRIDKEWINSEVTIETDFSIIETIKRWIHINMVRDLLNLDERKGGKRELV